FLRCIAREPRDINSRHYRLIDVDAHLRRLSHKAREQPHQRVAVPRLTEARVPRRIHHDPSARLADQHPLTFEHQNDTVRLRELPQRRDPVTDCVLILGTQHLQELTLMRRYYQRMLRSWNILERG